MRALTRDDVTILFPIGTEVSFDCGQYETEIVRDEVISEPYESKDVRNGVPFLKVQTRNNGGQFVDTMWLPNDVALERLKENQESMTAPSYARQKMTEADVTTTVDEEQKT